MKFNQIFNADIVRSQTALARGETIDSNAEVELTDRQKAIVDAFRAGDWHGCDESLRVLISAIAEFEIPEAGNGVDIPLVGALYVRDNDRVTVIVILVDEDDEAQVMDGDGDMDQWHDLSTLTPATAAQVEEWLNA